VMGSAGSGGGPKREEGGDFGGDAAGSGGGGVDEDPVGFALGGNCGVGDAKDLILADGGDLFEGGDPGFYFERVAGEGGAEISDLVGADDPGGAKGDGGGGAAGDVGGRVGGFLD